MHYLDDYFMVGPAYSSVCALNVKTILHVASQVGIPLAPQQASRTRHTLGVSGYLDRHQVHGNFSL